MVIPSSFSYAEECEENQGKLTITQSGNTITTIITGGVSSLNGWVSTDPQQTGTHKWIALDINTGVNDITTVKYNGSDLTSQDVADATAWGLAAGHFILWLRAEEVAVTPKVFTLSGDGKVDTTITINVEDANG